MLRKIWSPLKVVRYLSLLGSMQYEEFEHEIANEKNIEMRLYFLFQKSLIGHEYKMCSQLMAQALNGGGPHRSMIRDFTKIVLPSLVKENEYLNAEIMAGRLLQYPKLVKEEKMSLYHIWGNALYFQRKSQALADLIDKIEFEEGESTHPLVQWYRRAKQDGLFS